MAFYAEPKFNYPHPPIPERLLLVVESAICAAWKEMLSSKWAETELASAKEDIITDELVERLDRFLGTSIVPGFSTEIFESPNIAAKYSSVDKSRRRMEPDISIKFHCRRESCNHRYDAIYIEAKPVDDDHRLIKTYIDRGMVKFIDKHGRYAWAMQEAIMLGYVRPEYAIEPDLREALGVRRVAVNWRGSIEKRVSFLKGVSRNSVYETRHSRAFVYPNSSKPASGITIRHLWLDRP